jgi:hypothetical protein
MIGAARYFPRRYFAARYWPKVGAEGAPATPKYPATGTFTRANPTGTIERAGMTGEIERGN